MRSLADSGSSRLGEASGSASAGLSYRVFGPSAAPAVIFLHGFLGSAEDWDPLAVELVPELRCVAVDLPGHGGSVGLDPDLYRWPGAVRAVIAALDRLAIARAALVGYSMGGRLALALALAHPDRFSRLVLESASPGLETEPERTERRRLDEERARRLEAEGIEPFVRNWYGQALFASLGHGPERLEALIRRRLRNRPGELARALGGLGTGRQPSLWPDLATRVPRTLVLAGELDAKYAGIARRMAALGPSIEAVVVAGAGHNLHLEAPVAFRRLVGEFLRRAPAVEGSEV